MLVVMVVACVTVEGGERGCVECGLGGYEVGRQGDFGDIQKRCRER